MVLKRPFAWFAVMGVYCLISAIITATFVPAVPFIVNFTIGAFVIYPLTELTMRWIYAEGK